MAVDQSPPPEQGSPAQLPMFLPTKHEQQSMFRWFFFLVFAFLIWQLLRLLSLFSDAIIWAASLSLVFAPLYHVLQKHYPGRRNIVALVSTLGVLLFFLLPLIFVFWMVVQQSAQLYPTVSEWINRLHGNGSESALDLLPDFMQDYWLRISDFIEQNSLLAQFDLEEFMLANVDRAGVFIANFGAATARNILVGFINLILVLVLMFFCYRDGERFLQWLYGIVPMSAVHVEAVALRIYQTINAVITGALLTAGAQGSLAVIGYLIAGVPLAIFFGVLTGIAGMIPPLGAGLIWVPIGIFVFSQEPAWGIFIFIWGFFCVSMVDNFLKPMLIGSQARMPILLVFCAIIGGMSVYGFTGVIIGPILIAVLLAFVTIYRDYYLPGNDRQPAIILSGEDASAATPRQGEQHP